jgi:hypothetical protein
MGSIGISKPEFLALMKKVKETIKVQVALSTHCPVHVKMRKMGETQYIFIARKGRFFGEQLLTFNVVYQESKGAFNVLSASTEVNKSAKHWSKFPQNNLLDSPFITAATAAFKFIRFPQVIVFEEVKIR